MRWQGNGAPPRASLAHGLRDQHDDEEYQKSSTPSEHDRHRRNTDYRLVRTFAVQPRAFGAPLRGFRA